MNEIPFKKNELLVKEEISSKIERKMKRRARRFVFQIPSIENLKTGKETFLEGQYQIDVSIPYIIIIRIDTTPVKIVLFRYIHEKPNDLAFLMPSMRDTKYFTDSDNNKYTIYPSAFGGIRVLCENERFRLSGTLYSAK